MTGRRSRSAPGGHRLFEEPVEYHTNTPFDSLCTPLRPDEIPGLNAQIDQHLLNVRQALAHNEFLDVATAGRIAQVLTGLLEGYTSRPEAHQALIAGAARYFVRVDDAQPDTFDLLGFDDDVAVLNQVLDQIGLGEQKLAP